jgi:riboflavin kinase/FMN adenylyltransferase
MSLRIIDWETFRDPSAAIPWPDGAPLALSVGVFDGVHRGHQRLITKILEYAGEHGGPGGVITFRQSVRRVLHPAGYPGDIYSLPQKLKVLEELGVGFAVLIDFSGDFGRMSGKEFTAFLIKRRIAYLALGVNFRCGYRLDTGARLMRDMMAEGGTFTELVPQLRAGGAPVSSSRIRECIRGGDMAGAAALLGRPYSLDLTGLCPVPDEGVFSWDLGKAGRVLPPAGHYDGCIRSGAAAYPAEIVLDSRRLVLKRNSALSAGGGFPEPGVPLDTGIFLNYDMLSVEFRPRSRGRLTGSQ